MNSNKFHFIHIPKTGGMTIRRSLELKSKLIYSGPQFFSREYTKQLDAIMKKHNEHHGYEHARWRDLNDEAHQLPCVAFIRNPWSRVVSRYTFLMHIFDKPKHKIHSHPTYKRCSFEEFLEERFEWGNIPYFWHRAIRGWYPHVDHVTDIDGNIRCDILRTEHLYEDANKYFNTKITMHPRNVSNTEKKDYRMFYTKETKKIVEDWYAKDIETFGFTFDGPATKNIWNK